MTKLIIISQYQVHNIIFTTKWLKHYIYFITNNLTNNKIQTIIS